MREILKNVFDVVASIVIVYLLVRGYGWGYSGGGLKHWEFWAVLVCIALLGVFDQVKKGDEDG